MKELICKTCSSNGIVKKGEIYECEFCGTKYSPDEAEKLSVQVVVKNDNSEKIKALLRAGKKSRDMGNWEAAGKYYDEVLGLDPEIWEGVFYSAYCSARNCKIAQIASAARLVEKALKPTYALIKEHVPEQMQEHAVKEVAEHTGEISRLFYNSAANHYNGISSNIQHEYSREFNDRWSASCDTARTNGLLVEEIFGSKFSAITVAALKIAVNLYDANGRGSNAWLEGALSVLKKYDSDYIENRNQTLEANKGALKIARFILWGGLILAAIFTIVLYNQMSNGDNWIVSAIFIFIGVFAAIMGGTAASNLK